MNLSAHYDQMWQRSRPLFAANTLALDPLLDAPDDSRRGLTVVARLAPAVVARLQAFADELRQLEPQQYYYPAAATHLTVLSLVSCYPGFQLGHVEPAEYMALVACAVQAEAPFAVDFVGITASPATVLVQGFPHDDTLRHLRQQLRTAFQASALQQSIDSRYTLQTAHSTVVRFRAPLRQPARFLEVLDRYRPHAFGTTVVDRVELVFNDWYHRPEAVQVLHTFALTGNTVASQ
ncbi:mutarotase [Hymenobacter busanensis]|uniref:Mutarotase n=1 Tax=Hymenobacter busanensis TaxID=2607656 RepID=A0A7L4ZX48_9BACT|nr:2'-5' RNA ligase family protein [Hymenobacter busanensis]KAA9332168.1 mutarotase [Hymenobacter busanensis]QHJ07493.1 mutarotase [Hymenobacter busanensis]